MILTKIDIKSVDINSEINKKVSTGKLNELLLIVPTNRKVRYLKKEIISDSPGESTGKINLETIGTFSTRMISGNDPSDIITDAAASVLLKQSFQETDLKYFSYYKKEIPSGTLKRIKNVISEYKKHGITPEILKSQSSKLSGSEKIKAEDIADIYNKYQKKCWDLNIKEIGDIYCKLISLNSESFEIKFRSLYPEVNLVVVSGFDELTSPEIEIINFISGIKNCKTFLEFDYYQKNNLIFSHLNDCYYKLKYKGFSPIIDLSAGLHNSFQNQVKEKLFIQNNAQKNILYKDSVTKITAVTREKEVELIAKEIKDIISENRIEPGKICVVFNLIEKYSPVIRDIFSLYKIPFNLTDRFTLSSSLPVLSVINFLEIIENDFYYKNIFRALSGGYLGLDEINLNNLLKSSTKLKIISGYDYWIDTLNNEIKSLTENEGDEDSYEKKNDKEIYEKALLDLQHLNKKLDPFKNQMNLDEFRQQFINLIYSLDIPVKLINNNDEKVEENIKGLNLFIETIDELLHLFEIEFGRDKKFSLKFFLNNIRTAVTSTRFNIKEKSGYGVLVTTLNEIRGLKFDYLFIAGLCDGDFPTRYSPEIFFSDSYFRNEIKHQTEERYHFYQSLCSWDKGLYLTYPLRDERKEFSESGFLTEFQNLFEVTEKDENNYSNKIYSEEELLISAGLGNGENEKKNLNINNEIFHSINIDKNRIEEPFAETEFTGFIYNQLNEEAKGRLNQFSERQYSISQLENFAKCPFKYFAERVLKLKPVEEPSEEIESLEMGGLLHKILYEFYVELKKKKIILENSNEQEFKEAEELIFKIAKKIIEESNFSSPVSFYEKEKILGINNNRRNSILYKFLSDEKEKAGGFIPEYFEIVFGENSGENFKAGDVKLRGKIDRIDIDKSSGEFKVVDYKLTGKPIKKEDLSVISLQLPLYMYASKILIKTQLQKDLEPAGAEIYSLKFKEGDFGRKPIKAGKKNSSEEINILIEETLKAIEKYAKEIKEGKFHLSTLGKREDKVCRFCNFKSICRITEVE